MNSSKSKFLSFLLNLFYFILGAVFSIVLLISVIQHYSFNTKYFKEQFKNNRIAQATGFQEEELDKIIRQMTGYLSGKENSFNLTLDIDGKPTPVFNDRELLHMLDVKVIYVLMGKIKYIGIAFLLLLFLPYSLYIYFTCSKHRNAKTVQRVRQYWMHIFRALSYNGIFTLALIAALGYMLWSDFSRYFIKFHEIFFDNDLWLLNPETDRLIQMLPEVFFFDITTRMVILYALLSLGISIVCTILYFVFKKDETSI